MASVLTTLGASTYASFESYAAGADLVSPYDPYDDYASALTGAIGDSFSRPIMFRYVQIYTGTDSTGTIKLEIATADTGAGGVNSSDISGTDTNPDWNVVDSSSFGPLQYAAFAKDSANTTVRYYYGYYKNSAATYYPKTGASTDTAANPNAIYLNGTQVSSWTGRVLSGRIGWYHVPYAPTGATLVTNAAATSATTASIGFRWTHPTDDGISTSLSFGGLYGYRIAYKKSTDSTWSVFGSGTSGSPSGCHYLQGTSAYDFTTTPPAGTPSSSTKFTTTGAYETVTGLTPNTTYNFKVAGLNLVTDRHNGAAASIVTTSPTTGTRAYGNHTATAAHVGTNLDANFTTALRLPTVSGSYTATAYINQSYSSNATWTQEADGGVLATTLSYSIASGSLPAGLSLNTSTGAITGTPTTAGSSTFTITATNLSSGTVTISSQTITVSALGPLVSPSDGSAPTTRATAKAWNGSSFVNGVIRVYDGTSPYNSSGWKYLK